MVQEDLQTVRVLKALADETRYEIVRMLCKQSMCGGAILERFHITQPTLSYHMKILIDSGLVIGKRDGAWVWYSLNRDCFIEVRKRLCHFCDQMDETDDAKEILTLERKR